MANKTSTPDTALQLSRTFPVPREKVFRAWTDPKELMRWFAPSDDFTTPLVETDLRVGGKYRIQMKSPDGELHTVIGTYREVVVPEKLVFTWAWEGSVTCGGSGPDESRETLVTVQFHQRGTATEITLTHEFFQSSEERDKHNQGWSGCLDRLEKTV